MDSLGKAWRAEPRAVRSRVARAVNRGQRLDKAREATLAVWYAGAQMRNQPRTAALNFVVLVILFGGLRVLLDDNSAAQAFSDPQVYVVAAIGVAVQLFVHARSVRPRLRASLAANAALLQGRARKGAVEDADFERLRELVSQPGWLERRWNRHS